MKRHSWMPCIAVLALFLVPTILTHAIWSVIYIHELVEKSDIVFFGRVTGTQFVSNDPPKFDGTGGFLHTMRIDRVLYGGEKVKQAIFSETDLKEINKKLKPQPERTPVTLLAFKRDISLRTEDPMYSENETLLYFLKISKFPADLPDTTVIFDDDWDHRNPKSGMRTKSDLTEEYYFEACYRNEQATWRLDREYYQKKLPVLEAFCEVMSIPDLDQRKKALQRLEKHPDTRISSNASAALRKLNQPKPSKRQPAPPDQGTKSTD